MTGLLARYVPEWSTIARRASGSGAQDFALDSHSFLALRRLHQWLESDDAFAARLSLTLRHRDWVYLAVLLHEADRAAEQPLRVAAVCPMTAWQRSKCSSTTMV